MPTFIDMELDKQMKTTTTQTIIEPIKDNKRFYRFLFAAIIAANYPVIFQLDEVQLYPLYNEQDMGKFIQEMPNLFVFAGDYPHFAITTQAGIPNFTEKLQDFMLEEVDNSKCIVMPLTEFLNHTEQTNDLNPVSFVKTLVLQSSNAINNQFFWQQFDDETEWTAVKNPDMDFKYIAALSKRIQALCELLDLIKNNEDVKSLTSFIEKTLDDGQRINSYKIQLLLINNSGIFIIRNKHSVNY